MSKVLIYAPEDLQQKLRRTILWRPEIERLFAHDPKAVMATLCDRRPGLLVVDGRHPAMLAFIRTLRADEQTRAISIAALLDDPPDGVELALREAGANVVLSERMSEPLWDDAIQELVNVPPRRAVTLAVSVAVGARPGPRDERFDVMARNISVRGLLVETRRPLPSGTVVTLFFNLPASESPLHLVGRVVWERPMGNGLARQGVEFLGFHGDALGRIASFVMTDASTSPS
jgi:CheY-like chemotaxis protein